MSRDLSDPKSLRAVLERHAVRAAKGIGQHFLTDRAALAAIVDAAELSSDDDVLEIVPGPGVLTAALADRARRVPARSSRPPPKVDWAAGAMRPPAARAFAPLAQSRFLALVSGAFRRRRKQLRGALGFEAGLEKDRADEALRAAGIEPTRRPEELSLAEGVALAKAIG